MNTNNRKRISPFKEEILVTKKSKPNFVEVFERDTRDAFFDETLSDKYQPQFMNYQLIGDLVAIMILHGKDLLKKTRVVKPILFKNYCHSVWSVHDVLLELKAKKRCYPIAKTVILSVGYNDYHNNSMNPLMLAEHIEKIIEKLHRRGCRDIILTNIPPCAADCDGIDHWKYLQIINEEIMKLSDKYDYVCHCNIFKLFCSPKNYFANNKDYVTFRELNFKIDFPMYNETNYSGGSDLITFSDLGKKTLVNHLEKVVQSRVKYLRHGKVNNVICVLEENVNADNSPVQIIEIDLERQKLRNTTESSDIIDLDSIDKDDDINDSHFFGCTCEKCKEEDEKLMDEMINTIKLAEDEKDEKHNVAL